MQPMRIAPPALPPTTESGHVQAIENSHGRSRAFGLREHERPDLALIARADLQVARERNHRLCEHAMPVMEMLWEQIAHTQSMVVLTDVQGTVLHALGDADFLHRAHRVALAPGAIWSEAAKGTNAVGTALIDEQPTLVHAREHFLSVNHFLTCSAAPIFDHASRVLGVIDVSGDQRSYHPHTLALARLSARLIENQWFGDRFRGTLKLHLHASPHGLGTVQEGIVAVDADGRILGANRCALAALGRSASRLRHERLETLFGVSLAQMADHARRSGDAPMTLVFDIPPQAEPGAEAELAKARGATLQWAPEPGQWGVARAAGRRPTANVVCAKLSGLSEIPMAIHPAPSPPERPAPVAAVARPAVTAPRVAEPAQHGGATLREREIETIRQAVAEAGGNMTRAARALGIGRSTLYRKLR